LRDAGEHAEAGEAHASRRSLTAAIGDLVAARNGHVELAVYHGDLGDDAGEARELSLAAQAQGGIALIQRLTRRSPVPSPAELIFEPASIAFLSAAEIAARLHKRSAATYASAGLYDSARVEADRAFRTFRSAMHRQRGQRERLAKPAHEAERDAAKYKAFAKRRRIRPGPGSSPR
jgi:hypothetical protein